MYKKHEVGEVFKAVSINAGFWGSLIHRNHFSTLPHVLKKCEEVGNIRNLEIAAGRSDAEYVGGSHEDSDLFKVLEGLSYSLAQHPDKALSDYLDEAIELIAASQESDGYLSSYFTAHKDEGRYRDLQKSHELYCAGHLMESAVAHFETTGKRHFLEVAIKLADHLDATFGVGKLDAVPGHQEVELALVRLYKATSEKRYLELCRYFVDRRGDRVRVARDYAGKPVIESERHPGRNRPPEYRQDHLPPIEQREPIGHAVRAGYTYTAMADIALECGSEAYAVAVNAIWDSIVSKHLYITGGIGTHQHRDEGFGDDYLLPNVTYCETCGGIALLLFSHRMSLLKGEARYADVIETILYNHMLSCTDLQGINFNYKNPLLSDGSKKRNPWPNPACCPSNIVRMIPQIARYIYAMDGDALYIDQFVSSTVDLTLDVGRVTVTQQTNYPWDGRIELTLHPEVTQGITLHIRIPGWIEGSPVPSDLYEARDGVICAPTIRVNGDTCDVTSLIDGYCVITRIWHAGDCVSIDFPMPVRRVYANDKVAADRGRVALMRGPILYCLEGADHDLDLDDIILAPKSELTAEHVPDLLGGVTVIREKDGPVTAIPYYAWNNREPGKMLVWIKEEQ